MWCETLRNIYILLTDIYIYILDWISWYILEINIRRQLYYLAKESTLTLKKCFKICYIVSWFDDKFFIKRSDYEDSLYVGISDHCLVKLKSTQSEFINSL